MSLVVVDVNRFFRTHPSLGRKMEYISGTGHVTDTRGDVLLLVHRRDCLPVAFRREISWKEARHLPLVA